MLCHCLGSVASRESKVVGFSIFALDGCYHPFLVEFETYDKFLMGYCSQMGSGMESRSRIACYVT